jgi:C4-type Zn-finger protein
MAWVHMDEKECPLCGESMHLVELEALTRLPGTTELKRQKAFEWQCPECEYFEEADPEGPAQAR